MSVVVDTSLKANSPIAILLEPEVIDFPAALPKAILLKPTVKLRKGSLLLLSNPIAILLYPDVNPKAIALLPAKKLLFPVVKEG